jgi:hypothetical protein
MRSKLIECFKDSNEEKAGVIDCDGKTSLIELICMHLIEEIHQKRIMFEEMAQTNEQLGATLSYLKN